MSGSKKVWVAWAWRPYAGYVEVARGEDYAQLWADARALHPELNAKLAVLPEGIAPNFRDVSAQRKR